MEKTVFSNSIKMTGFVYKPVVKTGESKKGNPYTITKFGIKQNVGNKTLIKFVTTFNVSKDMPLHEGDVVSLVNGIVKPVSYKDKNDNWVNTEIVDGTYALIVNETEGVVIQQQSEVPKSMFKSFADNSESYTSDTDTPF